MLKLHVTNSGNRHALASPSDRQSIPLIHPYHSHASNRNAYSARQKELEDLK